MDLQFYVNLIVTKEDQTKKAVQSLKNNCTKICTNVYFMEGDIDCLKDDGVVFNFINEFIVSCLGNFSEKELIKLCKDELNINPLTLKYKS